MNAFGLAPLAPLRFDGTWWLGAGFALLGAIATWRTVRPMRPAPDGTPRPLRPLPRTLATLAALAATGVASAALYDDLTAHDVPLAGLVAACLLLGLLHLAVALRVQAIPAPLRSEGERFAQLFGYAVSFAIGSCYGLLFAGR